MVLIASASSKERLSGELGESRADLGQEHTGGPPPRKTEPTKKDLSMISEAHVANPTSSGRDQP